MIIRRPDFFFALQKKPVKSTQVNTEAEATERSKLAGLAYSVLTRTRTGWHSLSIQRFISLPMPAKTKELQKLFRVNTVLPYFGFFFKFCVVI